MRSTLRAEHTGSGSRYSSVGVVDRDLTGSECGRDRDLDALPPASRGQSAPQPAGLVLPRRHDSDPAAGARAPSKGEIEDDDPATPRHALRERSPHAGRVDGRQPPPQRAHRFRPTIRIGEMIFAFSSWTSYSKTRRRCPRSRSSWRGGRGTLLRTLWRATTRHRQPESNLVRNERGGRLVATRGQQGSAKRGRLRSPADAGPRGRFGP